MHGSTKKRLVPIAVALPHDSARLHVTGTALYIDDKPELEGCVQTYIAQSCHAHARIVSIDLSAVRAFPGVSAVLTAANIPGKNDISCSHADDETVFAEDTVHYFGQPIFAVAAASIDVARNAAKCAQVIYEPLEPVLTIAEAIARRSFVRAPRFARRGNPDAAIASAPHRLEGRIAMGGQNHFYLEGQISVAVPTDDGFLVYCSSQNPSEVQALCAQVMDLPSSSVAVEVRRMGGGFGGKETQPAHFAAIACLVAKETGRAAKVRLDRDDDMIITGNRHEFEIDYKVGFDSTGRICGVSLVQKLRCGFTLDLSHSVAERGMLHTDNAYFLENVSIASYCCRTNTSSNTAFRGFGVPQGVMGIERVILDIARHLDRDPLDIRKVNFYQDQRDVTHYGQRVENLVLPGIISELERDAQYHSRRVQIAKFNAAEKVHKRGIALVPIMQGISFTRSQLNQAAALVHIYKDGSVSLNHGGTEMGQGLFIKVAQIVATEFGIPIQRVRITAATTEKVPNTSPTAASIGSDMNGMAALDAVRKLKRRLCDFACEHFGVPSGSALFSDGRVALGTHFLSFDELVAAAYVARVPLSATGFFRTPHVDWDGERFHGRPFLYFTFGAAVAEVIIDTLTGEYRVERVDILHDVGRSLNPAIDVGQIEGGFIQGMGWLTTEELWWDAKGRLRTHAPSTYKIPVASDIPSVFNVKLYENEEFRAETPYWSKAVGEPPLTLAISVYQALAEAVAAARGNKESIELSAPLTPERILLAVTAPTEANPVRMFAESPAESSRQSVR